MHEALIVALICGVCSLDATALLQGMFSRPLVVGTLCGFALRDVQAGFSVACIIELIWLGNLPVGSVVPPDFSLAAALASGVTILLHRELSPQVNWEACGTLMVLCALPLALLGGWSDLWQRRKSIVLATWVERRLDEGDETALTKVMGLSLFIGFCRSFILAFLGMLLLPKIFVRLLGHMPAAVLRALEWSYWLSLLLGFVVLLDLFWERRWLKVLIISFVVSAVAAYGLNIDGRTLLVIATGLGTVLAVLSELRLKRQGKEMSA